MNSSTVNIINFCRALPKTELHAHLNGSLSRSTMLELKRYYADSGIADNTNAFMGEFEIGAGDPRNLSDCFQVFGIAHALTTTPDALSMATSLTLKEFEDDGCCYIELRSTPRDTPYMNKRQYVETIVMAMQKSSQKLNIVSRLIISINRSSTVTEGEEITSLAIDFFKSHPDVVVGIELSGNPNVGKFEEFIPSFMKAREAGLKITLHCGEVCNPTEVKKMLLFKPERIGHAVCIHPKFGGNDDIWSLLCDLKIPVEVCLTSNVNTHLIPDYNSHHFKELYDAGIPVVLCTDDKGVFSTSLSHEYMLCVETFGLNQSQVTKIAFNAIDCIFASGAVREILKNRFSSFDEH